MNKKLLKEIDKEIDSLKEKLTALEGSNDFLEIANLLGRINGLLTAKLIVINGD